MFGVSPQCGDKSSGHNPANPAPIIPGQDPLELAPSVERRTEYFRFDTFGSERFWGDQVRLHEAILGEKLGGVGPGLTPKSALELGLKVDAGMLPRILFEALRGGWSALRIEDHSRVAAGELGSGSHGIL